ncbi:MAG: nucleotide exchange factor GrpE [bacterium]|nr:nucleotide exchange factor GrpE [bacterium]
MNDAEKNSREIEIMSEENSEVNGKIDNVPESDVAPEQFGFQSEHSSENRYRERLMRLQAEFANYKKRVANERVELSDLFRSQIVAKLLPLLDDFDRLIEHSDGDTLQRGDVIIRFDDRLIEHSDGDTQGVSNGIKLIHQNLKFTLEAQGLSQIKSVGEQFDPNYHEALLVESDEQKPDGVVVEEWRKGYLFKEKLLRPAQVKVNKIKS